jgi:hypothetical protein
VRDPAGHRLRVTGAQRQRSLGDELDILGVGLSQIECAGARRGNRVGRRGGVDRDAIVIKFGRKLLVSRFRAALTVP